MLEIVLLLIFCVWSLLLLFFAAEKQSDSKWFCETLEWHQAPKTQTIDDQGIWSGTCPRCQKHVVKDSSGNWL